jgi:hypothetical protein
MNDEKAPAEGQKNALDTFSQKRGRGRPWTVRASEIPGRASSFQIMFENIWGRIGPELCRATSEDEILATIQKANPYDRELTAWASLILEVVKSYNFPKTQKAQIKFLSDSIAALGKVSPRRSRDICATERLKRKQAHHVLRFEFFIECSCRYKGHSQDHACPKCGAQIQFPLNLGSSFF